MTMLRYLENVTTLELDASKCNGCQMCIFVCPHEVFAVENKRAIIADKNACMECGACALNCEPGAITVQSGVGCAAAVINGMVRGGEPTCDCGDDNVTCC
jgi:NAD-dependent dihydropyrimidine dehydrogenase PreA subunit